MVKKKTATNITLDFKHNEMKKKFKNIQKNLSSQILKLKKLYKLQKEQEVDNNILLVDKYLLEKKIKKIEEDIEKIKNRDIEWEYYEKSSILLYNYYDSIKTVTEKNNNNDNNDNNVDFFNKNNYKNTNKNKRANILDKYINNIDNSFLKYDKYDIEFYICNKCNIEKTIYLKDACMICETCGRRDAIYTESDCINYNNPPLDASNIYSYKRINHLKEWLSKFQAKETIEISIDIFNQIYNEIKKERIFNLKTLTYKKIKGYLKKLKLSKYYDHVPYILYRITGNSPPRITKQMENNLENMFMDIEETFIKVCPKSRKNFLSYPYVLYKLMESTGMYEYKDCFKLLKDREKLHNQDIIWKIICRELDWVFIKSV
jgi:hypothetical protein